MARFLDPAVAAERDYSNDFSHIEDYTNGQIQDLSRAKPSPDLVLRDSAGIPAEVSRGMGYPNSGSDVYTAQGDEAGTDSNVEKINPPDPSDYVHKISAQLHDLGRVKSNVADMVRQGASEKEIDSYIKSEGTTTDAIKALDQKSIGKYVDDIGRVLALGATFGFADKMAAGLDALLGR